MNKFFKILQNYLLFAFPFVALTMIWSSFQSEEGTMKSSSQLVHMTWELCSWNLMLWFATLILYFLMLISYRPAREHTLKRIANMKERDERENLITGKASKRTYISMLSLLVFLFFISIFHVSIERVPHGHEIDGRRGTISIDFDFKLLDLPRITKSANGESIFESNDIPLTKSAIILMLIVWQLFSFNWNVRKELKDDYSI